MFLCLFFLLECLSPSSLHISAFPHHFLPLFYSICLFGFPPLSFSCSFDFLYLLGFGLCSVSSSSHSSTVLVCNTCKGNLPLHEVYTWSSPIPASGENEVAGLFLQRTRKNSAKGNYQGSPHNTHQFPFPRQFRVARLCQSCCSSSPAHGKAVKDQMAEKYGRELVAKTVQSTGHWIRCMNQICTIALHTTNITEIQADFEESLR